jgi:hypothetical protein
MTPVTKPNHRVKYPAPRSGTGRLVTLLDIKDIERKQNELGGRRKLNNGFATGKVVLSFLFFVN